MRNYGGLEGLAELREIFADLLGVEVEQVVCGGNSSLTMMHDTLVHLLLHGAPDSPRPWKDEPVVKFVCPVPGYDRHFTMLADLGIEMVTVEMREDGPDAEAVAALVADDPSIKGMWIVPTYANPTGSVCSQEVAARLMSMPTAAPDFRVFWDNAYAFHHLTDEEAKSADALSLASASGHPDRPVMFASTSKITFAGAGVAVLATSVANKTWFLKHRAMASIGPDKINHLRHVEFFGSPDGVLEHMRKHREIIAPKFAAVDEALTGALDGLGVASWTRPTGGYFVNLDVVDGTASRVVQLAKEAGIALTPAGSAFPHGRDPRDRNIRLAPTFPGSRRSARRWPASPPASPSPPPSSSSTSAPTRPDRRAAGWQSDRYERRELRRRRAEHRHRLLLPGRRGPAAAGGDARRPRRRGPARRGLLPPPRSRAAWTRGHDRLGAVPGRDDRAAHPPGGAGPRLGVRRPRQRERPGPPRGGPRRRRRPGLHRRPGRLPRRRRGAQRPARRARRGRARGREKDAVGQDVGIDGAGASAEEAAMHVESEGDGLEDVLADPVGDDPADAVMHAGDRPESSRTSTASPTSRTTTCAPDRSPPVTSGPVAQRRGPRRTRRRSSATPSGPSGTSHQLSTHQVAPACSQGAAGPRTSPKPPWLSPSTTTS